MTKELAYLAYHFHWSRDEILELPHAERRLWVGAIGNINETINRDEAK
jgi:hypothetical protein